MPCHKLTGCARLLKLLTFCEAHTATGALCSEQGSTWLWQSCAHSFARTPPHATAACNGAAVRRPPQCPNHRAASCRPESGAAAHPRRSVRTAEQVEGCLQASRLHAGSYHARPQRQPSPTSGPGLLLASSEADGLLQALHQSGSAGRRRAGALRPCRCGGLCGCHTRFD